MSDLWVVAPVYNEEKNLRAFVEEWIAVLRKAAGEDFTFCLLNDGSTDGSPAILNGLAANHPELRVIDKVNTGHGSTCLMGYELAIAAGARWVFQIDSDGQCDPAHFETFWEARSNGPVHYGVRRAREDGWSRRVISRAFAVLIFLLSFRWIRDANVPYRLMRRDALEAALERIPRNFRLANALLAFIHQGNPGIEWHVIPFRKRAGRQLPIDIPFFLIQAGFFIADYLSWIRQEYRGRPLEIAVGIGRTALALFAAYYLIAFIALALIRIFALVEYDWLEGFHMAQVHRLLMGKPLYTEPSLEYVPVLYGPFYAYVSSAFVFILGEHYASLRLVSLLAALGTQLIIGMAVWRKTRSLLAAWLASGFYAGMYGATGFFYDLARVDSLYLFLTMAAGYAIWVASEKGGPAIIGAVLAATGAVLTKQPALIPVVALCLWSLAIHTARARTTALLCLGAVVASQLIPPLAGNQWFIYYLYTLPSAHPLLMDNLHAFFSESARYLIVGLVLSGLALFMLFQKPHPKKDAFFFLVFASAMLLAGLAPRIKIGGTVNNLMPLAAATALCCGLFAGMTRHAKGWRALLIVFVLLCFNVQILYAPGKALPSPVELKKVQAAIEVFRKLEPPIFAPCHPYLPLLAQKNGSAFWAAMYDIWLTQGKPRDLLGQELYRALEEKRFRAVVLPSFFFMKHRFPYRPLTANYQPMISADEHSDEDIISRNPLIIYVPRTEPRASQ